VADAGIASIQPQSIAFPKLVERAQNLTPAGYDLRHLTGITSMASKILCVDSAAQQLIEIPANGMRISDPQSNFKTPTSLTSDELGISMFPVRVMTRTA